MYGPYGIYLAELYQFPKLKIAFLEERLKIAERQI
jgi:hypothetical protein